QPVKAKRLVAAAAPVRTACAGPPQTAAPAAVPATPAPLPAVAQAPAASAPAVTSAAPSDRSEVAKDVPRELPKTTARIEQPAQSTDYGTGKGILGVLPANSRAPGAMAYADANPRNPVSAPAARVAAEPMSGKPALKAGTWIIQVGALESEAEANKRLNEARSSAAAQ